MGAPIYRQYSSEALENIGAHAIELEALAASQVHNPAYAEGWNACLQALRGFVWHNERESSRQQMVKEALQRGIAECGLRKREDDTLRPFEDQPEHVQKMVRALQVFCEDHELPDGCCGYVDDKGACCCPVSMRAETF